MADAGFFGQPIERPLMLFQQLVDADSNHCNARPPVYTGFYHSGYLFVHRIYCILDIYASLL
jgi:hypothetical protein